MVCSTICLSGLFVALYLPAARADSVNSPNITLNVDTNRAASTGAGAGDQSITINTITIAETMLPEYSSGADSRFTIQVQPGFQFDPDSNVSAQSATIGINGAAINTAAVLTPSGVADEILSFTLTSGTNTSVQDIIRVTGVRVRILSAVGAAGPAKTTMTITTSTAGGAFTNQGIVAANIAKGAADRLEFAAQPGGAQSGGDLLPAVKMIDFGGNLITNDPRNVTLTIQFNPGAAALLGISQRPTINGVATWVDSDDLRILTAATGYTLRASHDGAPFHSADTVDSGAFDIVAGTPDHLVITTQPVATAAGADILVDVSVFDAADNLVTATPVDVTLDSAVNPGGWPLLVDTSLTKATTNGVASWTAADHLRINKAVNGYRLLASGAGAPVESSDFDVTPADPDHLRFVQQPADVQEDAAVSPPVSVEVVDAFDNRTDSGATVLLALGTSPCGGVLSGNSATSSAGLATFDALAIDTPCAGIDLLAFAGGLVGAQSDSFSVIAAPSMMNAAPVCGLCGSGLVSTAAPLLLLCLAGRGLIRRRVFARR